MDVFVSFQQFDFVASVSFIFFGLHSHRNLLAIKLTIAADFYD